jgi:hypothetical protein
MALDIFTPRYGSTIALAVGGTAVSGPVIADAPMVRCFMSGNDITFIRFSTAASGIINATNGDFPLLPNSVAFIAKPIGADTISALAPGAGTDTLYVTSGQ